MAFWIDTHCHLDALEFAACGGPQRVREEARAAGVGRIVIPAVDAGNFAAVRELAHRTGDGYALGFHPLYLPQGEVAEALERLDGSCASGRTTRIWSPWARSAWIILKKTCARAHWKSASSYFFESN